MAGYDACPECHGTWTSGHDTDCEFYVAPRRCPGMQCGCPDGHQHGAWTEIESLTYAKPRLVNGVLRDNAQERRRVTRQQCGIGDCTVQREVRHD